MSRSNTSYLQIGVHLVFWLTVIALYYITFQHLYSPEVILLRVICNVIPLALLFYLNLYLVNLYIDRQKYFEYFLIITIVFIFTVYIRSVLNVSFPSIDIERLLLRNEINSWAFGASISGIGVYALSAFIAMLKHRHQNEIRQVAFIQEHQEAQLQFLRAQINPHFLFNTLNNIYYLAYTKSDKTADMVLRLSNLLRYVIYEGKESMVSLAKEVSYLELFIELFQMRNEEKLDIRFNVKSEIQPTILIEPMILIPIIENCFKHCNFETSANAYIHIDLFVVDGMLHFQAVNTKDELDLQKDKVGGVGLKNIRKRLDLKYENEYLLTIKNSSDLFDLKLQLKTIEK